MEKNIPQQLKDEGLISDEQFNFIIEKEEKKLFSIYWELRIGLYLGVTLLSTGLGILIYENIDTIGHQAIIAFIALLCGCCFYYCWRNRRPFTMELVESPTVIFDYILLLGCLIFLTLEGYLQYQYKIFGEKYGLVTGIPTLLFFIIAYFFDHRGVLAMAISGLALWLGITLSPKDLFEQNDFNDLSLILSGLGLGLILILVSWRTVVLNYKAHFEFTYLNFGTHLFFVSAILGMISFSYKWILVLVIIMACLYFLRYAKKTQSFYFLLVSTFYGYFTSTYLFILLAEKLSIGFEVILLYYIISCAFIIFFFLNYKKFLTPVQ